MVKSANEIALEAKVEALEKQIEEFKTFERRFLMATATLVAAAMIGDSPAGEDLGLKSFEQLTDLAKERMSLRMKSS